jgi:hypothetical protein
MLSLPPACCTCDVNGHSSSWTVKVTAPARRSRWTSGQSPKCSYRMQLSRHRAAYVPPGTSSNRSRRLFVCSMGERRRQWHRRAKLPSSCACSVLHCQICATHCTVKSAQPGGAARTKNNCIFCDIVRKLDSPSSRVLYVVRCVHIECT